MSLLSHTIAKEIEETRVLISELDSVSDKSEVEEKSLQFDIFELSVYPPGASGAEQDDIDSHAGMARTALDKGNLRHAKDLIDDLSYIVEKSTVRGQQRLAVLDRINQLIAYVDNFNQCTLLKVAERQDLKDRCALATGVVEEKAHSVAVAAIVAVEQRLATLETSVDVTLAFERLVEHANKGISQSTRNAFAVCLRLSPNPSNWNGLLRIKLRQRGLLQHDAPVITNYTIDGDDGLVHARARHTFAGIYGARQVLTAHPTDVAIFATDQDLVDAVAASPTAVTDWYPGRQSGRFDTHVGNIHYQGTVLSDTIALNSVYPTNRNFRRQDVEAALSEPTLMAFIERLTT